MEEFKTGQRLTADDLNALRSIADGQNIPTDKAFIKSTGVNFYTPIEQDIDAIPHHRVFDVRVRQYEIKDGDNIVLMPFWEVYLGSDAALVRDIGVQRWNIEVDAGAIQPVAVAKVFSQPIPGPDPMSITGYAYKNAITLLEQTVYDDEPEYDKLKRFDANKFLNNTSQLINGNGDGWFCTGLPANPIDEADDEDYEYDITGLYATFVRSVNDLYPDHKTKNIYSVALVFTNFQVYAIDQLRDGDSPTTLPDGSVVHYASLLGNGSAKIGDFAAVRNKESVFVASTSRIPSDSYSKENHNWEINVAPLATDPSAVDNQLIQYQLEQTRFIAIDGTIQTAYMFDGVDDDKHIVFSDFVEMNGNQIDIYTATLEYNPFGENDEGYPTYTLKYKRFDQVPTTTDLLIARDLIHTALEFAQAEIISFNAGGLAKRILLFGFIVNKNGHISDSTNWTIAHVAYTDTQPDFSKFVEPDYNTTKDSTQYKQFSVAKSKTNIDKDGTTVCDFPTVQLHHFNEAEQYMLSSTDDLSGSASPASLLIRTVSADGDNKTVELNYLALSAIDPLSAIRVDSDSMQYQRSIEWRGSDPRFLQLWHFNEGVDDTKTVEINSLSGEVDFLDSEDSILVKSGEELKYKKFKIKTDIEGSVQGYTGTQTHGTRLFWNTSNYKLELIGRDFRYENGLLKEVSDEKTISQIDTVGYTQL